MLDDGKTRGGGGGGGGSGGGSDEAVLEGVRFGAPLIDPKTMVGGAAAEAGAGLAEDVGAADEGEAAAAAAAASSASGAGHDTLSASVIAEGLALPANEPLRSGSMAGLLPEGTPVLVVPRRIADAAARRRLGQPVRSAASGGWGLQGTVAAAPMGVAAPPHMVWVRVFDPSSASAFAVCVSRRRLVVLAGLYGTNLCGADAAAAAGPSSAVAAAASIVPFAEGASAAAEAAMAGLSAAEAAPLASAAAPAADGGGGVAAGLSVPAGDSLVGPLAAMAAPLSMAHSAAASHAARLAAAVLLLAWPDGVPMVPQALGAASGLLTATKMVVADAVSGSSDAGGRPSRAADATAAALTSALKTSLARLVVQECSSAPAATRAALEPAWLCPSCDLRNRRSRASGCMACGSRPGLEAASAGPRETMSRLLIADCAATMGEATRAMTASTGRSGWLRLVESSHPMRPGVEKLKVAIEGASALFVAFNERCRTPVADPACSVMFFADEQCTRMVARRQGPPHAFRPFLAPVNTLYAVVRGPDAATAASSTDSRERYGLRCTVRGLRGVSWSAEPDIRREPSLEWACWLLTYLVREALPEATLRAGALHTGDMLGAMVRFLRTPDAPFKPAVLALVSSVLACPQYFSASDAPDLTAFASIGRSALALLSSAAGAAERLFPPIQLQHALEMAASAHAARAVFATPLFCPVDVSSSAAGAGAAGGVWNPLSDPSTWSPPLAAGKDLASPDVASLPELEALALARELFKPLASAARCAASSPRLGRIPDPWMARAVAEAEGGEPSAVSAARLAAAHRSSAEWTRAMDEELIAWLSGAARAAEKSVPALDAKALTLTARDKSSFPALAFEDDASVRRRFALLRLANALLARCLRLVDATGALGPASMGALLRGAAHLVFAHTKEKVVNAAVKATKRSGTFGSALLLDHDEATAALAAGRCRPETSRCLFVQVYEHLSRHPASDLRGDLDGSECLFRVAFKGQEGIDAGGLFRGTLTDMCEDLFPPPGREAGVDLFVRTPSCAADPAAEPEFAPNPARTNEAASALFRFVGVMMGVSLRFRFCMPFELAPVVWRLVAGDTVGMEDLAGADGAVVALLRSVEDWMPPAGRDASRGAGDGAAGGGGVSGAEAAEAVAALLLDGAVLGDDEALDAALAGLPADDAAFVTRFGGLRFVDSLPGGDGAPLVQGGERRLVLPASRAAFVTLVVQARLRRWAPAARMMRAGLCSMVPARVLPMLGGRDLRTFVCGSDVVDVAVLKAHTVYQPPYDASHKTVKFFWEVMDELSNRERQQVIRYAWGRSRLPTGEDAWRTSHGSSLAFRFLPFAGRSGSPDDSLIEAHTCFFQLNCPAYTSKEIMRKKLLLSVTEGLASGYLIA
ncbi:hypothetical protein FNF31_00838 [Cafeteria roenbergensis]|nr:hypothetical protein FNF31_00838 [Cafeteria roenbergensis]